MARELNTPIIPETPADSGSALPNVPAGALPPVPPAGAPINLAPVNITAPIPPAKPAKPVPQPAPAPSAGVFNASPLGPAQGVQEDARVFTDIADYYRKAAEAQSQGKAQEAQQHLSFAQQQEQSIAESSSTWKQAVADQEAREARMTDAINKGRQLSVDPDNYWNRKGTASNILAAISVGLGAFASGMTKGATGNPALQMVNQAIQHDIDSQKANIDNYWKSVQQQMHLDDNAFNRAIVTQNMQSNMRLAGYKVYEADLKSIQAKTDSQAVKLGAQFQIDQLQLAINNERKQLAAQIAAANAASNSKLEGLAKERRERFEKLYSSNRSAGDSEEQARINANKELDKQFPQLTGSAYASPGQNYDYIRKGVAAGLMKQNKGLSREDAEKMAGQMMNQQGFADPYASNMQPGSLDSLSKDDRQRAVADPKTGQIILFPNKEMGDKFRHDNANVNRSREIVAELKAIRAKHGGGFIGSLNADDQQKVDLLTKELVGSLGQMGGTGVLSEAEYKRFAGSIPNASAWSNPIIGKNVDTQLNNLDEFLSGQGQAAFQGYGGQVFSPNTPVPPAAPAASGGNIPFTPYGAPAQPAAPVAAPIAPPTPPAPPVPREPTGVPGRRY